MYQLPSPLEKINHPLLQAHGITLWVKRDDLIDPDVSGNKWRKLKYHLEEMKKTGFGKMVTFGGAFSNHIAAVAAASHQLGYHAIGVIRGEELHAGINPTLTRASELGMEFRFVSRHQYRDWQKNDYAFVHEQCPDGFVIPEGGASAFGMRGVAEIIDEIDAPFDTIITPIGTGTTMAGLIAGLKGTAHVLGVSTLKGSFVPDTVADLLTRQGVDYSNYAVSAEYHFGGYGKTTPALIEFINQINVELSITLDPIYTGKAFFGVWDMIKSGKFDHQTLIFLHTGGLQGIAGFNQKSPQKIHN